MKHNITIRTLLIDDEKAIRTICRSYLSERADITILGECCSIAEAEVLINATNPDLILLDIQLGDGTGFDLLSRFKNPDFKIIFITAFEQYAVNAIKAGALDYILKPIEEEELLKAIEKVSILSKTIATVQVETASDYIHGKPKRIILRTLDALHIIDFRDLMYCKSSNGYTTFYLADQTHILVSKPLKDYEPMLLDTIFIRTHQSYLVNVNFIHQLKKDLMLVLKNKEEIPVSFRKKEEIIKRLEDLTR